MKRKKPHKIKRTCYICKESITFSPHLRRKDVKCPYCDNLIFRIVQGGDFR